jgi:hypothetical protein
MLNHITDATRAAALRIVRSGRLYDLGRVLDDTAPVFPGRYFRQTLVTTAHHSNGGGLGANRVNWITEQSPARSNSALTWTPYATCRSVIAATTDGP